MTEPGEALLLAVDLGLRTGLAWFGSDGRLRAYHSQNYGARERLKRAAPGVLAARRPVRWVVLEGDAAIARIWERAAGRVGAETLLVSAERWRAGLLHRSEQRAGTTAKRKADVLARLVIEWSGAPRATSLRHDVAEAICIGLWGVVEVGLLGELPAPLRLDQRGA